MLENYCRTLYCKGFLKDGIVFFTYTTDVLTLPIAEQIVEARLQLVNGVTYPLLADVRSVKSVEPEALGYLAGPRSTHLVSAGALLVNGQFQKVASTMYLHVNKPPVTARLFTGEQEALSWLKQFKELRSTP